MRWKVVALVFICFFVSIKIALAENIAVKAATPVQVSISPTQGVVAGNASTFVIHASSMLASNKFVIEVIPPKGAAWITGPQRWEGSILPGQVKQIEVTLQWPMQAGSAVTVTASIPAEDDTRLAASASYRSSQLSVMSTKTTSKTSRKVTRKGRPVVEYSVR